MSGGENLLGHNSSSQSSMVIPNVNNPNIYYIFTADVVQAYYNDGNGNGLNYSIVDMSLNGGFGGVTNKNINLITQGSEKLTAVSALDESGYWVVTHADNRFYSYKVDANGVNASPVVSTVGPNISHSENKRGCIKISPNGKKIAVAHSIFYPALELGGVLKIYDFDVNTGLVSNEIEVANGKVFYGVEFSSNSTKLYTSAMLVKNLSGLPVTTFTALYQYDLDSQDISRTEYLVNSFPEDDIIGDLAGSLQIAFDKRIYHSRTNNKLSVIREPNLAGINCDFRVNNTDLGGRLNKFGLPSYIQSSFEEVATVENLCFNNATQFNLDTPYQVDTVNWNFGDPNTGNDNVSNLVNPIHAFSHTGLFEVVLTVSYVDREPQTYIEFIEINEVPIALDNVTLTQCDVDGNEDGITLFNLSEALPLLNLGNEDLIATYYKSLQDAHSNENALLPNGYENEFNNQIIYAKVFENIECYSITEVTLNVEAFSDLGTYSSAFICDPNDSGDLTLILEEVRIQVLRDFPNTDITFFSNQNDALLENEEVLEDLNLSNVSFQELYFRVELLNGCKNIGKLEIKVVSKPEVEDQISAFCPNKRNVLDAGSGFVSYLWSTGETTQKIQINQAGEYWVEVSHGADCTDVIDISAVLSENIEILDVIIDDFRPRNMVTVLLRSTTGDLQYSLDGGLNFSTSHEFLNVPPGLYELIVTRDDCNSARKTILVGGYPNFFTPNGDGIHDTWQIKKPEFFENTTIDIFDRFGKLLKTMKAHDSWDGKVEGNVVTPTDYWFAIKQEHKVVYGHFSVKL